MKLSQQEVTYCYHYGSDLEVVNAARVSFDKMSEWEISGWKEEVDLDSRVIYDFPIHKLSDKDAKLIHYLAKHNHWSPFGHVGATVRVKAPIFVARQLAKSQVGLVWNEVSRRYVDNEPEFYFPDAWRGRAENAKQGSGEVIGVDQNDRADRNIQMVVALALGAYQNLLSLEVAPEQARMVLPQNTMTEWIWTGSLAAWARVYKLRSDPHAQLETQEIAHKLEEVLKPLFPESWEALKN